MKRTECFCEGLPSEPWPMIHVRLTTGSQRLTSQTRAPFENSERLICIPFIKSWGKWPSMGINMPFPPNQAPLFISSTTRASGDKRLIMIQHPVWKYGSFIQRESRGQPRKEILKKKKRTQRGKTLGLQKYGAPRIKAQRTDRQSSIRMNYQDVICEVLIQVAKPLLTLIACLRWDGWPKCAHNCRSQAGTAHWLKWPLRHIANQPSLKLPLNGLP